MQGSVLIIDDEKGIISSLLPVIERAGFKVEGVSSGKQALTLIEESSFDAILLDLQMPGMDGLTLLKELKVNAPKAVIIMMTAFGNSDLAVKAVQLGAHDYIAKPFAAEEIILTLRKALERENLRRENEQLKAQISKRYSFSNIVAQSESMAEIFEMIKKIADYKTTVMIYGESGTGKELIAQAIHYNSNRRNKRFVAINCGAVPENLLESEFFGHKRGSFTDATRDKKGLFQEADGGTILLDEVGDLPLHLQVKLLRVLQEGEIRPVGDEQLIPIDVRVIAATLRDLEQEVIDGKFRDDLFYRLNVVTIRIPPLRERKEDIPLLVDFFMKKNQEKLGLTVHEVSKDAMNALLDHEWPGNVRELENCIERAMILTEEEKITVQSLPKTIKGGAATVSPFVTIAVDDLSIKTHTKALEKYLIAKALEKTRGNRTHAARLLEISHRTLLYKLKDYNMSDDEEILVEEEQNPP